MNRYKDNRGWRFEGTRHSLSARGISTGRKYSSINYSLPSITPQKKPEQSVRYVDMTVEQLSDEIKDEREFAEKLGASEYDKKELLKLNSDIEKYEKEIREEKEYLKKRLEPTIQRIVEIRKKIKKIEKDIKEDNEFKERRLDFIKTLERIAENKSKNPNYYDKK